MSWISDRSIPFQYASSNRCAILYLIEFIAYIRNSVVSSESRVPYEAEPQKIAIQRMPAEIAVTATALEPGPVEKVHYSRIPRGHPGRLYRRWKKVQALPAGCAARSPGSRITCFPPSAFPSGTGASSHRKHRNRWFLATPTVMIR